MDAELLCNVHRIDPCWTALNIQIYYQVYRRLCREYFEPLFRKLPAKERQILGNSFGVYGYEKLSVEEICMLEMLTEDGVMKLRRAALKRLRGLYDGSLLERFRDAFWKLEDGA